MKYILKRITILLLTAVLIVGELPVWTGAQYRNGAEEVYHAGGEAQPELAAEGAMEVGWNGVHSTAWGFEYMILLFAGCWALVMQIFRGIRDEINK